MIRYRVAPARPQAALASAPFHRYVFDDGTVWTEFHRAAAGYLLRFPGLADFEVTADGARVVAHPAPGTDEPTLEHLYINQLVPLALSRQGRPAYHASVVAVPGGAVAFLGKTGMGKSTLAASFALAGSAFLTDDALLVEETPDGCRVLPSHASLRLWQDSVSALAGALDNPSLPRAGPVSYSSKARLLAGEALSHCEQAQPLLAAYVLEPQGSAGVSVTPLSGLARYMAWLGNSFLLDIEDPALLARHFEWTHRISAAVPTFSLDYPREYAALPAVRSALLQHATRLQH